jgi:hypothetical protein
MKAFVLLASLAAIVRATPIDNGVQGDPEIECGPTSITITFNTQKQFSGHVYVKGLFAKKDEGCRTDGDNSRSVGQIELPFDKCNVQRDRSLNPKGVFVRTTVVISFHPRFLTKIDRAYTVQCFYMEADKTVSTGIEVSEITTGFQTQIVPMPVCRYEILDSPTGQPVRFAIIGQGVFHKWTCDTDTVNTFCMTVHSCFVDDSNGDRLDLLTDQGCATDKYLMNNLEYPTDLMAVKEVHVFKYADRPILQFQCQITILVKEPNGQCARPQCSEPPGQGDGTAPNAAAAAPAVKSAVAAPAPAAPKAAAVPGPITISKGKDAGRKRRAVTEHESAVGTMDVSQSLEALGIESNQTPVDFVQRVYQRPFVMRELDTIDQGICMSQGSFYSLIVFAMLLLIGSIGGAMTFACSRRK